jgi:hypothetical protein
MCIGLTIKEISLKTIEYDSKDELNCNYDEDDEQEQKVKPEVKNYFFDRTQQKGKPLLRNIVVDGLGLYIETDGELISYPAESPEVPSEQPQLEYRGKDQNGMDIYVEVLPKPK